jgi:LysM repeat protein
MILKYILVVIALLSVISATGLKTNMSLRVKEQTYTIMPGDTLTKIAAKFNTTVECLVKANNISNPDLIIAGQTLKIPS